MPVQTITYYVRIATYQKEYHVGHGYRDEITAKAMMRQALQSARAPWATGEVYYRHNKETVIVATGEKRPQKAVNYAKRA